MTRIARAAAAGALFWAILPAQQPEYESYLAHLAAAEASLRLGDLPAFRKWLARAPEAPRGFEWRLLDSLHDQSQVAVGTDQAPVCIEPGPDGALLAIGGANGSLELRDAATGNLVRKLAGHDGQISDLQFDANGARLVSASHDRKVRIWDVASGKQLVEFAGHPFPAGGAAFSGDGTLVASCSYDRPPGTVVGTVHIWRAADGELVRTLHGGRKPLSEVRFSPDGSTIAAGSWDFCVFLWDATSDAEPRKLPMPDEGKYNAVDAIAFSPDGTQIAASSKDDTARVWDLTSGELRLTLRGHANYVSTVRFSPDGRTLATGSTDETVRLWDARDGSLQGILRGQAGPVHALAFTQDGARLWSGGGDRKLRSWDARSRWYGRTELRTSQAAYSAVWSADGARLATCSFDGRIQLWDTRDWSLLGSRQAHPRKDSCHALAFSPDAKRIYSASYDKTVGIWDALTLAELGRLQHDAGLYVMRLAPDGRMLACGLTNGKVWLWDLEAMERRAVLDPAGGAVHDLAFRADSTALAVATQNGALGVWSVADGSRVGALADPDAVVRACAFHTDGRLVTGDGRGVVRVWDVAAAREVGSTQALPNGIARIAISADGKRAAAVAREVAIVDLDAMETTLVMNPHRESMWFCAWAPQGEQLATVAMDGTVGIHDVRPLAERLVQAGFHEIARESAAKRIDEQLAAGADLVELAAKVPATDHALRAEITRRFAARLPGPEPMPRTGDGAGTGR